MAATKTRTTVLNKIIAWLTANNNHEITGPQVNEITTDMMDVNCPSTALDGEISFFKKDVNGIRIQTIPGLKYNTTTKRLETVGLQAAADVMYSPSILSLTGGGTAALDGIVTAGMGLTGTIISFMLNNRLVSYQLQSSTAAENSPNIIRPDDYSGTNKVAWIAITVDSMPYGEDNGSVNAAAAATNLPYLPENGKGCIVKLANSVTSSMPTLNVNSSGDYLMAKNDGYLSPILPGELVAGGCYICVFDSANNAYRILNPSPINQIPHSTDTGSVNALAGTYQSLVALYDGLRVTIDVANTVTSTTPTMSFNGGAAKTIITPSGNVIRYGMMPAGAFLELQWDATADKWQLKTLVSNLWVRKYYTYADFSDASTSKYLTMETALPANVVPSQIFIHVGAYMTGGTVASCNLYLYSDAVASTNALSVFSGAALNRFTPVNWFGAGMALALSSGTWDWKVRLLSTGGNLNALTAGNVTVCYKLEQLNY